MKLDSIHPKSPWKFQLESERSPKRHGSRKPPLLCRADEFLHLDGDLRAGIRPQGSRLRGESDGHGSKAKLVSPQWTSQSRPTKIGIRKWVVKSPSPKWDPSGFDPQPYKLHWKLAKLPKNQ